MSLPLVAVVGRPNVGKSTFVNRIAQIDDAIVHEMRGVTRDRSYHKADWNGIEFKLIDTGGIEMGTEDQFQGSIRSQAFEATNEADVIVFIVDGKTGINADDEEVARILRKTSKPVLLAVNKLDTPNKLDELWEFYQLGLGDPFPISATHGHGTGDLLDEVVDHLRKVDCSFEDEEDDEDIINVAIIGRPNAGKSSLLNALLGYERAIVTDVPGTTRDTIDARVTLGGVLLRLTDTAGLRDTADPVEAIGVNRALDAAADAALAIAVFDAAHPLDEDDRQVIDAAQAAQVRIAVLNKSDLPAAVQPEALAAQFDAVCVLSAKERTGLEALERAVAEHFPAPDAPAGEILTNARHAEAIGRALESLRAAREAMLQGVTPDAVLTEAEEAMSAIGELTGASIREDITERIFARFCVGK